MKRKAIPKIGIKKRLALTNDQQRVLQKDYRYTGPVIISDYSSLCLPLYTPSTAIWTIAPVALSHSVIAASSS